MLPAIQASTLIKPGSKPRLSKSVLSQYLAKGCQRLLYLSLYRTDAQTKQAEGHPDQWVHRPGLDLIKQKGDEWETVALDSLNTVFGGAVLGAKAVTAGKASFDKCDLKAELQRAGAFAFIPQATFDLDPNTFFARLGAPQLATKHGVILSALRPDIIQVMPPGSVREHVLADGSRGKVPANDPRKVLRAIDVKLSSEPLPGHFAEVVLYSIALSNWLHDQGLDSQYVVSDAPAVWPGDALPGPWQTALLAAQAGGVATSALLQQFQEHVIKSAQFAVYAGRVQAFIQRDLTNVLGTSNWQDLPWHVHGACRNCEYLGPADPGHSKLAGTSNGQELCLLKADACNHLSRIAFLSRGARQALETAGIADVPALAAHNNPQVLERHQDLLAQRIIVPARAQVLTTPAAAHIPANAGTSVDIPQQPEVRIYLSTDFDPSTRISLHFTFSGYFFDSGQGNPIPQQHFLVPVKTQVAEFQAFGGFVDAMEAALDACRAAAPDARVQVYIWDPAQHEQIERVITRHFAQLLGTGRLARVSWAFPPEQRIPNADIESIGNAILVVKDPVRALLASPVPHYYKLEEIALTFQPTTSNPFQYTPDYRWDEPLSDSIPPERMLQLWETPLGSPDRAKFEQSLFRFLQRRHIALERVVRAFYERLRGQLTSVAPKIIELRRPVNRQEWSDLTRALYWFEKLEVSLKELETERTYAMSVEEREARHRSAVLQQRLTGLAEQQALQALGLPARPNTRVYVLDTHSHHTKFEDRAYAILQPAPGTPGMANIRTRRLMGTNGLLPIGLQQTLPQQAWGYRGRDLLKVEVLRIDRVAGLIALEVNDWPARSCNNGQLRLNDLERAGIISGLSAGATLDPVHGDWLTGPLRFLFDDLGRPPLANTDPALRSALGLGATTESANRQANTPLAEVLWAAPTLAQATHAPWPNYAAATALTNTVLNPSQKAALQQALGKRLTLIWGPPGTGKTQTLAHVVASYAKDATAKGARARILVTANSYTAIDNLLEECADLLARHGLPNVRVWRLRSRTRDPNPRLPLTADIVPGNASQLVFALAQPGIDLVGGPPIQVHNFLAKDLNHVQAPLWNLAIVDEASQITASQAALSLSALGPGGALVVAGDQNQLDPIRQAEAPLGLEHIVGSFLDFLHERHGVAYNPLLTNYRSNAGIVAIQQRAGYPVNLHANSPAQVLNLVTPVPTSRPAAWPTSLTWSNEWARILDPAVQVACFAYDDGISSQWNEFEAHSIACLVRTLAPTTPLIANMPKNRLDANGNAVPAGSTPYTWQEFWAKGVGIVTPHRAQRSLIVSKLAEAFRAEIAAGTVQHAWIDDAVDTVERFQGQERDVILVSYCVGDPDMVLREDEFLHSFNRFNVAASRPRCKLVLFVSNGVAHHVSQDLDVVEESRLLKEFVETVCNRPQTLTLPAPATYGVSQVPGSWRTP